MNLGLCPSSIVLSKGPINAEAIMGIACILSKGSHLVQVLNRFLLCVHFLDFFLRGLLHTEGDIDLMLCLVLDRCASYRDAVGSLPGYSLFCLNALHSANKLGPCLCSGYPSCCSQPLSLPEPVPLGPQ